MSHARRVELARRAVAESPEPLHMPLGFVFRSMDGADHLRDWREHAADLARGRGHAPATLYVNVPFCARVCTYCLLSASKLSDRHLLDRYVGAVRRQIAAYASAARGTTFGSLHVGGGTPTLLSETSLDELFTSLAELPLAEGAQIGVEAHPATSTPGRLAVLRRHGVHRLSFGVESLTPEVLDAVNRADQTEARVVAAVKTAREMGFEVNIDLLAGLPGETAATWKGTVERTLALQPDSLSVNRFLGENSALAAHGYGPDEAYTRRVDEMLLSADRIIRTVHPPRWPAEPLATAGFGTQYVWDRSETARPYFQDDMMGPVSTLAFGHGALGHLFGRHFSVPAGTIEEFVDALEQGRPPRMAACPVDERFEMAIYVADRACRGDLGEETFERVFGRRLDEAMPDVGALAAMGLLVRQGGTVRKVPSPSFQVMELLAFLLHDVRSLAAQVKALSSATLAQSEGPALPIDAGVDLEPLLSEAREGRLDVDVGRGLDADKATALAGLAARKKVGLRVVGDERRALAEYGQVREELPPSLLWTRIAVRAAQAGRGEQRLLKPRRGHAP